MYTYHTYILLNNVHATNILWPTLLANKDGRQTVNILIYF